MLALAPPAAADVEFYQAVDRSEVGLEDTFQLTIVVSDAPRGMELKLPSSSDFEILSRSQSTQMSIQFGSGFKQTQKYILLMKAKRLGELTIPAAVLTGSGKNYSTEPIRISVKQGRLRDPNAGAGRNRPPVPDPFQNFPFPTLPGFDDSETEDELLGSNGPRSESDLFLRASVDKHEVYVGDQMSFSVYIFSRVDLSSVDSVTMPKLEGFWSEDLESPSQLGAEQRLINGVPYRAYLLRRLALFPVRPGTLKIGPTEADITTGFLFAGRRIHRAGNELTVKVKALPPGGPAGASNVGKWHLSSEASSTRVELGQPVTIRVILEGRGNLKNTILPPLASLPSLRVYDPTTADKTNIVKGRFGGRRTQEYLVMPQQTGTFTLPGLSFSYFNPESEQAEVSKAEPIVLTVVQGALVATPGAGAGTPSVEGSMAKNVLTAGGLRPLRYEAHFSTPGAPIWRRRVFLPVLLTPPGLWLAAALAGLLRARIGKQDDETLKRRQARTARRRLAEAEKLKDQADANAFYAEVENALSHFLDAKLGAKVGGLVRPALDDLMKNAGISDRTRARVLRVLEHCDLGRFAPGGADGIRTQVLAEARAAMEEWE